MVEVKNLQELLLPYIGPKKKIVSSNVSHLVAPGENYMTVVAKVDVDIQDEDTGEKQTINAVGKCIHSDSTNEFMNRLSKNAYKREKVWYTEILPLLQNFVKENESFKGNFDIFPKLIAHRPNVHGENDEVDEDAILLMENLAPEGFKNIDRSVGFDYEGAKVVLKDLATFHAVPLAMKLKKPEAFEDKIKKHLTTRNIFLETLRDEESSKSPPDSSQTWLNSLAKREHCKLYLPKLKVIFDELSEKKWIPDEESVKNEPFVTINHTDFWVNNTLQLVDGDTILENKIIDFQVFNYESPARDLLFFIWSSVQLSVVKNHFEDLLQFYHRNFLEVILNLECDSAPFGHDQFQEELKTAAKSQLIHTLFIAPFICGKKGEIPFEITKDSEGKREWKPKEDFINDKALDRVALALQICGEKEWI